MVAQLQSVGAARRRRRKGKEKGRKEEEKWRKRKEKGRKRKENERRKERKKEKEKRERKEENEGVSRSEQTWMMNVTPPTRGSVDYPSTCGIQVDVGLPHTISENRAESPLYGELYP